MGLSVERKGSWSSCPGTMLKNQTTTGHYGGVGLIPSPVLWVKGAGVVTAAAQIQSLIWELPHAVGAAIKILKRKKERKGIFRPHIRKQTILYQQECVHSAWESKAPQPAHPVSAWLNSMSISLPSTSRGDLWGSLGGQVLR